MAGPRCLVLLPSIVRRTAAQAALEGLFAASDGSVAWLRHVAGEGIDAEYGEDEAFQGVPIAVSPMKQKKPTFVGKFLLLVEGAATWRKTVSKPALLVTP